MCGPQIRCLPTHPNQSPVVLPCTVPTTGRALSGETESFYPHENEESVSDIPGGYVHSIRCTPLLPGKTGTGQFPGSRALRESRLSLRVVAFMKKSPGLPSSTPPLLFLEFFVYLLFSQTKIAFLDDPGGSQPSTRRFHRFVSGWEFSGGRNPRIQVQAISA